MNSGDGDGSSSSATPSSKAQQGTLTHHDKEILDRIFSQELFIADNDDATAPLPQVRGNRKLRPIEEEAAQLELQAIRLTEQKSPQLQDAVRLLTQAIALAPEYPSPYNNRAQVYRLLGEQEKSLADLNRAIELCDSAAPNDFSLVKRQALNQRAWLRYQAAADGGGEGEGGDGDEKNSDAAYKDFEAAAALGSTDARRMAVRCNPYARLCNDIMQEMLSRLYYSKP
jgi:tetratricopeptide (TPR) repeat protein